MGYYISIKIARGGKDTIDFNPIAVSQISILEIAIKQKIGKLPELPLDISELYEILSEDGFEVIPLKSDHIAKYGSIPLLANH